MNLQKSPSIHEIFSCLINAKLFRKYIFVLHFFKLRNIWKEKQSTQTDAIVVKQHLLPIALDCKSIIQF